MIRYSIFCEAVMHLLCIVNKEQQTRINKDKILTCEKPKTLIQNPKP